MPIPWPSERISRAGLVEFIVAAAALLLGFTLLRRGFLRYLTLDATTHALMLGGLLAVILSGIALFRLARRREYPWIVAFAAVALPLYAPYLAPYDTLWRVLRPSAT